MERIKLAPGAEEVPLALMLSELLGDNLDRPDLSIETDSATLLDLANINIRFGMPYYFDEVGREFLKKLARRDLKIKGMFAHPIALTKLTKIMSIN